VAYLISGTIVKFPVGTVEFWIGEAVASENKTTMEVANNISVIY
jgi:hypothetical protein